MKNCNFGEICKNAMGTVFLLAGAFFVCSTLLSMRAVFADPVAPTFVPQTAQSPRATGASGRASGRNTVTTRATAQSTVARTATTAAQGAATSATQSRSVSGRPAVARGNSVNMSASRATGNNTVSRGVVARTTSSRATQGRNVTARTAVSPASRVSVSGNVIRGSKANANITSSYNYLSNKLYTGNYSNIIDSTTGLISAEAYNNCLESYYTCMDEICTARNAAQRRCACAGRVKAFAEAETALESANEELIKVSGELALLIANKGKDVSEAFQLTEAEKVMNCVSWQEMSERYRGGYKYIVNGQYSKTQSASALDAATVWCEGHGIYDKNNCSADKKPSYCSASGNSFGFDVANLDGTSSDILASLQSWANAKEQTLTILTEDNNNLLSAFDNLSGVVSGMAGLDGALTSASELKDSLAETWGYELFEYAHNNVCNRVLDSCFNGIYEACGTPPSSGRKCTNGASQCPYNYNSMISVSNTGNYELNFVTGNSGYTASNSATCFGYTSSSGDPYATLRGPVADARRSILQKYALDANADCDAYGEQLRATAQNIGYQKIAAQQALQQKRLEFYNDEQETITNDYRMAMNNFNECLSELYDCYTTQETSNASWSTSRIKTYCGQVANAPHCYEQMVCGAPNNKLQAVVTNDINKDSKCNNSEEFTDNTCRNVITLAEILSGSYAANAQPGSSAALREACLQDIKIEGVRQWAAHRNGDTELEWGEICGAGYHVGTGNKCEPDRISCTPTDTNAYGTKTWNTTTNQYDDCVITGCKDGYVLNGGACVAETSECTLPNATSAYQIYDKVSNGYICIARECNTGYHAENNACVSNTKDCTSEILGAVSATKSWNGTTWGACIAHACGGDYDQTETGCEKNWAYKIGSVNLNVNGHSRTFTYISGNPGMLVGPTTVNKTECLDRDFAEANQEYEFEWQTVSGTARCVITYYYNS